LTHDPNDPQMPQGIDPNDFVHWDSRCDLDHDYEVDLDDLVVFTEDDPQNWLWTACWRDSQLSGFSYAISGMSNSAIQEGTLSVDSISKATSKRDNQDLSAKSLQEQLFEVQDNLKWLETLWLTDPEVRSEIAPKAWQDFMNQVYDGIRELENSEIKSINLREAVR
jgi:hypothetical protein